MFKQRESSASIISILFERPMDWCSIMSANSQLSGSRKCLLRSLYWGASNNNLLLTCVINLHQTSLVLCWLLCTWAFKPRLVTWHTSGTKRHQKKKSATTRGSI